MESWAATALISTAIAGVMIIITTMIYNSVLVNLRQKIDELKELADGLDKKLREFGDPKLAKKQLAQLELVDKTFNSRIDERLAEICGLATGSMTLTPPGSSLAATQDKIASWIIKLLENDSGELRIRFVQALATNFASQTDKLPDETKKHLFSSLGDQLEKTDLDSIDFDWDILNEAIAERLPGWISEELRNDKSALLTALKKSCLSEITKSSEDLALDYLGNNRDDFVEWLAPYLLMMVEEELKKPASELRTKFVKSVVDRLVNELENF